MKNQEKDRHVLAAAVASNSKIIVTQNQKDFPEISLKPYNIEAKTADQFLLEQFNQHSIQIIKIMEDRTNELKNPPITTDQTLQKLSIYTPIFAQVVRQKMDELRNNPDL